MDARDGRDYKKKNLTVLIFKHAYKQISSIFTNILARIVILFKHFFDFTYSNVYYVI